MRHPLLLIFVSDWRRKLTALGLAFALWLWVDGQVADDQTHTLRIITTSVERAVEPGTLQIRMPEGWTLMKSPGNSSISEVEFDLVGSGAQIEAFLATGFSASFDAELDRLEPTRDEVERKVQVLDLHWSRPDQAKTLLAESELDRSLRFQFVKLQTATIEVGPYLLDITGKVPEGYVVLVEELSFDGLTDIRIEGPATTLGSLFTPLPKRKRAFEAGNLDLAKSYPALLEPLVLDGQRRDIQVQIRLHPHHVQTDIRLLEEYVVVNLPIRLADPNPRPIPLEANMLTIVPDPEGEWEAPAWVSTNIQVVLSSEPDGLEITGVWLFEHLMFILPLDRIPDSALGQDEYQLRIEWTLADLEDDVKDEVQRRLTILFEDESKQTVTVQRKR